MVLSFVRKLNMSPGLRDTGDVIDADDITELQVALEGVHNDPFGDASGTLPAVLTDLRASADGLQNGTVPIALAGIEGALDEAYDDPSSPLGTLRASADRADNLGQGAVSLLDYYPNPNYAGTGEDDDTEAWYDALTDAIAKRIALQVPPPQAGGFWRLTDTIDLVPPSGQSQSRLNVLGFMNYSDIRWYGPSDTSIFRCRGLKDTDFSGLHINISNGQSNVVAWDLETTTDIVSQSMTSWRHCNVYPRDGYANTGWLLRSQGGTADHSFMHWADCMVGGNHAQGRGTIGWHIINPNALVFEWENCFGYNLHSIFSGRPREAKLSAGISSADVTIPLIAPYDDLMPPNGGTVKIDNEQITYTGISSHALTGCTRGVNGTTAASHLINVLVRLKQSEANPFGAAGAVCGTFLSCGGGYNERDYNLSVGSYAFVGGRWEVGHDWINTENATVPGRVTIQSPLVSAYTPSTSLIRSGGPMHWDIDGGFFRGADYSGKKFFVGGGNTSTPANGVLSLSETTIQGSSDDFWQLGSNWRLDVQKCARGNADDTVAAIMQSPYATSVSADYTALLRDELLLVDDSAATRTITLPAAATCKGQRITAKKLSASNTTVLDGDGSETIDGATTKTISSQYGHLTIVSDGTGWQVVGQAGTIS